MPLTQTFTKQKQPLAGSPPESIAQATTSSSETTTLPTGGPGPPGPLVQGTAPNAKTRSTPSSNQETGNEPSSQSNGEIGGSHTQAFTPVSSPTQYSDFNPSEPGTSSTKPNSKATPAFTLPSLTKNDKSLPYQAGSSGSDGTTSNPSNPSTRS